MRFQSTLVWKLLEIREFIEFLQVLRQRVMVTLNEEEHRRNERGTRPSGAQNALHLNHEAVWRARCVNDQVGHNQTEAIVGE
jgi:hypothetical protein